MRSEVRVAVIGGGIADCSTPPHLTREGRSDVALFQRDELTSGTTRHSAAQVTDLGTNQTMVGLKSRSIALDTELSQDPDHPVGYRRADGGIRLAGDERTMEGYRHFASMARGMGVELEVIAATECARRRPLPATGSGERAVGPARRRRGRRAARPGARPAGAGRGRPGPPPHTGDGAHAVAGRGRGRRRGLPLQRGRRDDGVTHPVASMDHQYMVTEAVPEVAEAGHRMPRVRCPISDVERQPPWPAPTTKLAGLLAAAVGFRAAQRAPSWLSAGLSAEAVAGTATSPSFRLAAVRRR